MLPSLKPQVKADHECNIIFFTPGIYKMDIQCYTPDSNTMASANSLVTTGHIWKYIPSVAIQVT